MPQTTFPSPSKGGEAIRFAPVVHLQTGESVTLIAETQRRFEERAVFGRAAMAAESSDAAPQTPAMWLADHIEDVANHAHANTTARPVIVSAPLAALLNPDTAVACDAAMLRTRLCPQEICIEVSDASFALPGPDVQQAIEAFRRCGFRVSLDATRSWQSALSAPMRLLLDNMRIDARYLESEPELDNRVEAAIASGMSVIAENAPWRDGDYLSSLGIDYALRPRADA